MVLVIDTSGKEAIIALVEGKEILEQIKFEAGRSLNAEILEKITSVIPGRKPGIFPSLQAIVVNAGPGSFTGLRIGLSVANAMAYSLNIPIYGFSNVPFDELLEKPKILQIKTSFVGSVLPEYGAEPTITTPKKH